MPARLPRRFGALALAGVLALACPAAAAAQAPPTTEPPPDAGASVYKKVLRSTVWIMSDRGGGRMATGTGSLIDRGRRLVLTNYHVVGDVRKATVYFPIYENGKAVSDKKAYTSNRGRFGIDGEVIELDKQADLALIRIDRVPDGVPALAVATDSPEPGQTVHSIGNPGRSGALWVYTPGKVRQVYGKKWKAKLDERTTAEFQAKVVETDSATNPGDSGGPLVNDKGELVGVTQGGAVDAQLLSTFVDVTEVRKLINRRSVATLRTTDAKDPPKATNTPPRDKPLAGKDDGKFFSEAGWKKAQAAAERLFKEKQTDLLIETFEKPPQGDPDKVRGMSAAEKDRFFRGLAQDRVKAEKVNGVYILVCRNPTYLYVDVTAASGLGSGTAEKLRSTLLGSFKEKKFDDGLEQAVKLVLDARGLGEKK